MLPSPSGETPHSGSTLALSYRLAGMLISAVVAISALASYSIYELSAIDRLNEEERRAHQVSEALHEAVKLANRSTATFAILGLDLTPEEKASVLAKGKHYHDEFRTAYRRDAATLRQRLPPDKWAALQTNLEKIRHIWRETLDEIDQTTPVELDFRVFTLAKLTEEASDMIQIASAGAKANAEIVSRARERQFENARTVIAAGLILAASALLIVGFLSIRRWIVNPIKDAVAAVSRIANGDLDTPIPLARNPREIQSIFSALVVFRGNALANAALEKKQLVEFQNRDSRREKLEASLASFQKSIDAVLTGAVTSNNAMRESSHEMMQCVANAKREAEQVARATGDSSAAVAAISISSSELSLSSHSAAENSQEAERTARRVSENIDVASKVIADLSNSIQSIADMAKFIDGMAQQTNLLALNATIEAARAGAAGRGFSVVAQEVKNLAAEVSKAADGIGSCINEIRAQMGETIVKFSDVSNASQQASEKATKTLNISEAYEASTGAISSRIEEYSSQMSKIAAAVENLQLIAGSSESAVEKVVMACDAVSTQSDQIKHLIENFVSEIKTA